MNYKYHPIIEGLKVREDGKELLYFGEPLTIHSYDYNRNNFPVYRVNLLNRTMTLAKLVCEAWHGEAPTVDHCALHKESIDDFHYTNLFWGLKSENKLRLKHTKRPTSSKIKESDIPVIIKRLKKGDSLKAIAIDYGTSDMSISRIKTNHYK